MHPITKGLACEEACHRGSWGRRTCTFNLKCLKTLTPDEVLRKLELVIAPQSDKDIAVRPSTSRREVDRSMNNQQLSLTYYGYVFDASGYGRAARDYIHALHKSGVKLSVFNLADRDKQIDDPLIESLIGKPQESDFHLFHGIPTQWSRLAFSRRNCIGMTVWETDTVPSQWHNPLNHTLDVWVPSNFNVDAFSESLESPVFRLPHPVNASYMNGAPKNGIDIHARLGIDKDDFVFYSIFEWQDRKNPNGILEAYFRAFRKEDNVVLLIKANPGAARTAPKVLDEYRRRYDSDAHVILCCESLTDDEIQALHRRGDCYVSLHYGEGWAYPLFDAASLGTPVVATRFSGPLDYLDPDYPGLVDCDLARVGQAYVYYNRLMHWAVPRLDVAADRMRWVFDNYDEAKAHAHRHRRRIIKEYSAERVGAAAKSRLLDLLCKTQRSRGIYLKRLELADLERPDPPIPGSWYDSDYFEHGLKSNWREGYSWDLYGNLFRDAAKMLTETFATADSFLDAGCAKGFLVRCIRESGKDCVGVDHSDWAINNSDALTRKHLRRASIENYAPNRQFDVLLALNLFESLSDQQVIRFMKRARKWTSQAMFAVISTVEDDVERGRVNYDRDLSHVSLKSRAEWDELFKKAGWRQDALHELAQRTVQDHALCRKMGWRVFVYSPV
jgi:glycosyltransferase involved in cell wall biosynthesis